MVISSIDLMDGKAVQLVEGREKKLERDNPVQLADQFDRYGEVAVIDLDAALGRGNNRELIKAICARADCRVGGGIRSVKEAVELVSFGARKVIIGSRAFDGNAINRDFLGALAEAVGRERIIAAVDSRDREIVVNGWRTPTGQGLMEAAKQLEPMVSELLFTCVEREGRMQGIDMEAVRDLRNVFSGSITAAGGVSTLAEIEELAALEVNVQLGMALYTGKIKPEEAFISGLKPNQELVPVVTVDRDNRLLMQAYANREALEKTFETGKMWYWSRSRRKLWQKGETSGNFQEVVRLRTDCDGDTVMAVVEQTGGACHLGDYSCFGGKGFGQNDLYRVISDRFDNPRPGSYTATLDGVTVREKILEEAKEVVEAETRDEKIWEAADLLYFLTVLMQKESITVDDVLRELYRATLEMNPVSGKIANGEIESNNGVYNENNQI